ncbi:MAG TPA: hypothetical protein VGP96_06925, partial [Candidatus Dormibacteraeota bacterium]|nr:hypothetical protein [Candidatus Dormibacteraeota bacterium]
EQLVRLAGCNVLLSSRTHVPPLDTRAAHAVVWTDEAEARMERIPAAARGIARTAVLRWCTERGHTVVSSGDVDSAVDELMPFQRTLRRIGEVAATLDAAERAMLEEPPVEQARALCTTCGYAASAEEPVVCPVCGGPPEGFERLDVDALLAVAAAEGEASETGFDGRRLGWTMEARALLHQLPAGYLRRRVKAIIEKAARTRRLPAITVEMVEAHVRPELEGLDAAAGPHRAPIAATPRPQAAGPLRLPWSLEAESRIERIPEGFIRNLAREQVERLALQLHAAEVTALHVEAGIAEARAQMQARLGGAGTSAGAGGCPVGGAAAETPAPGCPVSHGTDADQDTPDPYAAVADLARGSQRVDPEVAREMTRAAAEARARLRGLNEVTAGFVETLGKKMGYGHPASPLTHELFQRFTWTPEAEQRLTHVPDFCREMVRWRVEWFAQKRGLGPVITPETVEGKLAAWGEVSSQIQAAGARLPWTDAARARLDRVPESVRGEVMQAIEGNARAAGATEVDDVALDAMVGHWTVSGDFHQGRFGFKAPGSAER